MLSHIRCFVLDMDGTVYLGNQLLPGATDFLEYLRKTRRDFLFLTNNSSRHAGAYAKKLAQLGIACDASNILTSGEATAFYLNTLKKNARVFLLGTPELEEEFRWQGFTLTDEAPDFVVLGFDTTLTYGKLVTACDLIRNGIPFVATHPDLNCPTESGYIPDCGAMTALVSASTGVHPKVIGKPNREIIDMILRKRAYAPDQLAIVGDRLYTDMATGINAGICTVLVLSGETKLADLQQASLQPRYVCRDLADLTELVRQDDACESATSSG
jgi:HAD superfamily hydrolase (TIGR01457 family)